MTTQLSTAPAVTAPSAPEPGRRSIWADRAWADWARLVIASSSRILLLAIVGSLLWTAVPSALGWKGTTVMSDSMAPGIRSGDVVVAMPTDDATIAAALGKVILFDDPDHAGRLRLHRFVDTTDDGLLITRGDANPANDSTPISIDVVEGVAVLRAPFVGLPMLWMADREWMLVAAAGVALLGMLALSGIDAHLRRERDERDRIRPRTRKPSRQRGRMVFGAASAIVVSMLVVGNGSHAAFSAANPAPASSFATQSTFDCFSTATITDSPLFYYRFSEASGTVAADSSTNARTGTLQAGNLHNTAGCSGASPSITLANTATGFVKVGTTQITATNALSMEAWIKTAAGATGGGSIVSLGSSQTAASSGGKTTLFMTTNGRLAISQDSSTGLLEASAISTTLYNDGNWHHVVATVSTSGSAAVALYVDGGTPITASAISATFTQTGYFRLGFDTSVSGSASAPTNSGFVGSIDNAAAYGAVLSAARVAAHFAVGH